MRLGVTRASDDGRRVTFVPELVDDFDATASEFVGFGGTPSPKRLVLRTWPDAATRQALLDAASSTDLTRLADIEQLGVYGIHDLGGRGLGLPRALFDSGDPQNYLLRETSVAKGAFLPALDFGVVFETLPQRRPRPRRHRAPLHGPRRDVLVRVRARRHPRFGALRASSTATTPPLDADADGTIDRRFIYGGRTLDVGLNLPGRLTGAPAVVIEHLIDDYNAPKPGSFSNPNGDDFLVSLGFGLAVPINSPFGARFQHIYRATDASPSKTTFAGTTLDLVGLAWSPFLSGPQTLANTSLDGFEVLVGLSGVNKGRGPDTNQVNGIPVFPKRGTGQAVRLQLPRASRQLLRRVAGDRVCRPPSMRGSLP